MPPPEKPVLHCRLRQLEELDANPFSQFWQSIPPEYLRENLTGHPPRQNTDVRVVRDKDELRILFDVVDSHISATITQRDGPLWEEEVCEVFLDCVGDGESYFEFEVNPLNTVLDLVLRRNRSGYKKDFAWNCENLRTLTRRTTTGWAAELSIPFRSLAASPPVSGSTWRANFLRIDRPPEQPRELSAWSPTYLSTFHASERFGYLIFE